MNYKKVSAYTIIAYISKFSFLLIFPIIRRVLLKFNSINENLFPIFSEVFFVFLILIYSFLEYKSVQYKLTDNSIIIKKGILIKKVTEIPYEKIHYVRIKRSIFSMMFSSCKIILGTPNKYRKDTNIFLKNNDIHLILKEIFDLKEKKFSYKISNTKILFMSIMWSNIFASLLIAVPFINKVGSIIGKELSKELYSSIDKSEALIKIGIPPVIATLTFFILAFFLVSIFSEFLRYANFKVKNFSNCIIIRRGFISNDEKIIKKKYINAVAIKQTLWMKLFKVYSAYIYTIGYAKDRTDKSLLIVALKKNKIFNLLQSFNLEKISKPAFFNIKTHSAKSFLFLPLVCLGSLFTTLAFLNFQTWYQKITSLIIYFFIPFCLWWLIIKILAYKNTSLKKNSSHLIISSYDKFSLYTSYVPLKNVQSIAVSQNFIQKFFGNCNISIFIMSDRKYKFRCKQLNYLNVKNFVNNV